MPLIRYKIKAIRGNYKGADCGKQGGIGLYVVRFYPSYEQLSAKISTRVSIFV